MTPKPFSANRISVVSQVDWGPDLGLVEGDGGFHEVVGPTRGAKARSLYAIRLGSGARTRWLRHQGEAAYFFESGRAIVRGEDGSIVSVREGSMVHCAPGVAYSVIAEYETQLLGGPCPADGPMSPVDDPVAAGCEAALQPVAGGVRGFHRDEPGLRVPFISRDARLVIWLGAGACSANMNYVVLEPGERNREHVHRFSEDTIYVLDGRGTVEDITNDTRIPIGRGDTVQIPPGVWHAVIADQGEMMVSVGGPCPADLDMLRVAGADVDAYVDDVDEFIQRYGIVG